MRSIRAELLDFGLTKEGEENWMTGYGFWDRVTWKRATGAG